MQTGTRTSDSPDSSSVSSNDSNERVSCSFRDMTSETSTSSYASCDSKTKSDSPKSSSKLSVKSSYKSADSRVTADEVISKIASPKDLLFTSVKTIPFIRYKTIRFLVFL
jgi:hypothetical protein